MTKIDMSTLGDIAEFRAGAGFPRELQGKPKGDYPFAKVGDISRLIRSGNSILSTADNYIDQVDLRQLRATPLPKGTIVFAKIGEAIRQNFRAITSRALFIDNNVVGMIPDCNRVDLYYLYYYMRKIDLYALADTTAVPSIRKSVLESIPIPLPPLPEQKRIAAILHKANAILRKRRQAIKLADDFLRATFLEMFGDPVANSKGWGIRRMDEIALIQSGITKGRKVNGESVINVPYMRVANVQDGYINLAEIKEIEATAVEIERYSLLPGDILLTEGGDPDKLGRGAVWRGEINPCIHQNHIFKVRPNPAYSLPDYLSTLIGSSRGKQYFLIAAKQTTGIASINKTQLSSFPVLLPPLDLQQRFARITQNLNALRQKLELVNNQQNDSFNSLAQRAFRGEL